MSTDAARLLDLLVARGLTLAVAESLTGGLVQAALVDVPGASQAFRGGVVAYANDVKADVLGVDLRLLAERGAVDPTVALAMALGVSRLTRADVGLATTGVAGPDPQDGRAPGTVFVAAVLDGTHKVTELSLTGDREQVRLATRDAAIDLALRLVASAPER